MDTAAKTSITVKDKKQYIGLALRALNMLGTGLSQIEVARSLGVSESTINGYCQEEDFKLQLNEILRSATERAIKIDNNYEEIERIASDKLRTLVNLAQTPNEVLRIAKFANDAKRKVAPNIAPEEGGTGQNGQKRVAILLPRVIINNYVVNQNKEIVSVDGTDLVTLNSASLDSLVKRMDEATVVEQEANTKLLEPPNSKTTLPNGKPKDKWAEL